LHNSTRVKNKIIISYSNLAIALDIDWIDIELGIARIAISIVIKIGRASLADRIGIVLATTIDATSTSTIS